MLLAASAAAAEPVMTYQGRLKEGNLPVTDVRYFTFTFCLNGDSDCNPVSPTAYPFNVENGLFKSTFTVPAIDLSAGEWFLKVGVGPDAGSVVALSPVERLTFVPYAVYAATAAYVAGAVRKTGDVMNGQLTVLSTITVAGSEFSVGGTAFVVTAGKAGVGTLTPDTLFTVKGGSLTIAGTDAALVLEDAARVITPDANAATGAGISVSTNVYIVGFSSAARYYGDGSQLYGVSASGFSGVLPIASGGTNATSSDNARANLQAVYKGGDVMSGQLTIASTLSIVAPVTEASALRVSTSEDVPLLYVSTGGFVGLGTSAPSMELNLYGNTPGIRFATPSTQNQISDGFVVGISNSNGDAYLWNNEGSPINFGTSDTRRAYIAQNGNVSIGDDTTPDANLEVIGTLMLSGSAGGDGDRLVVDASGKVGVGTAAPVTKFEVANGSITVSGTGAALILSDDTRTIAPNFTVETGAGISVSTNVYIVGFSSASRYFGDGSALTNVSANGLFPGAYAIDITGNAATATALAANGANCAALSFPLGVNASGGVEGCSTSISGNAGTATTATNVTGIVAVANGGTNSAAALSGNTIMITDGTSIIQGSAGTTSTVLHGNAAGAPTYSAVALTSDVSGILPAANGGTESAYVKFDGPGSSEKTFTLPDLNAGILTDVVTVTVPQGGTGAATFTSNGVVYGNAAGALQVTAAGTAGYVLTAANAAAPTWTQATNANTPNTIVQRDASGNFSAGTITATNFTGALTGNADTATTATTAGGAPPTGAAGGALSGTYPNPALADNASYPVATGVGNGLKFWSGSDTYKISMGNTSEYQYGTVTDYSIKTAMGGAAGRGFTWGQTGSAPVASLNVNDGVFQTSGTVIAPRFSGTLEVYSGVVVSSEANVGVRVSSNVYIVGYSSAAMYYGDGSGLAGVITSTAAILVSTGAIDADLQAYKATVQASTAALDSSVVHMSGTESVGGIKSFASAMVAGDAFSVGGSTFVVQNGLVGIGGSSPEAMLQIAPPVSQRKILVLKNFDDLDNTYIEFRDGSDDVLGSFSSNYGYSVGAGLGYGAGNNSLSHSGNTSIDQLTVDASAALTANLIRAKVNTADKFTVDKNGDIPTVRNITQSGVFVSNGIGASSFASSVTVGGYGIFNSTVQMTEGNLKYGAGTPGQVMKSAGDGYVYWGMDNSGAVGLLGTPYRIRMENDLGDSLVDSKLLQNSVGTNITLIDNSSLTVTGAFNVAGSTLVVYQGTVGIGTATPQAALDVVSTGTSVNDYAQVWRDSQGVIRATMTANGVLYADGTGIRNVLAADPDKLPLAGGVLGGALTVNGSSITINADAGLVYAFATKGVLISTMGAIQTTGPGSVGVTGDPRGALAVDLQATRYNTAEAATGDHAVITGGGANTGGGSYSFIGGGNANSNSNGYTVVAGGNNNSAGGYIATVGGGSGNSASGDEATISGGMGNTASGQYAFVGGGYNNLASQNHGAIAGGWNNTATGGDAFVGGGGYNSAPGSYSMVPGGSTNTAKGDFSFAAGLYSSSTANGSFTWADSEGVEVVNGSVDRTVFKNRGGFMITDATGNLPDNAAMLEVISTGTTSAYYAQIWRNSTGVAMATMTAEGRLYAAVSGDGLGNHVATTTLLMQNFPITGATSINAKSLAIGDGVAQGESVSMLVRPLAASYEYVLFVTTGYHPNDPTMVVSSAGFTGLGTKNPAARLDVVSTGTTINEYAQIWRSSEGTIQASMTATGRLYAAVTGDNLGNHNATQNLQMNWHDIQTVSNIASTGTISAARVNVLETDYDGYSYALRVATAADTYAMVVTTNGYVGLGTGAPLGQLHLQASSMTAQLILINNGSDTNAYQINGGKSRGDAGVVQTGDELLSIGFYGRDNNADLQTGGYSQGAVIRGLVDGAVSAGKMPGRLEFMTTPSEGNRALTRLTIDSAGRIGIGTTTPGDFLTVLSTSSNDGMDSFTLRMISSADADDAMSVNGIRSRGTRESQQNVGNGDTLFSLGAGGRNNLSSDIHPAAAIIAFKVDGTPAQSANDMPGRIEFMTTADNGIEPVTRLVIKNDGAVGISTNIPQAMLDIVSTAAYSQIWRNSSGVIVASMTAEGQLTASVRTSTVSAYALNISTGFGPILTVSSSGVIVGGLEHSTASFMTVNSIARNENSGLEDITVGLQSYISASGTDNKDTAVAGNFEAELDGTSQIATLGGLRVAVKSDGTSSVSEAAGLYVDAFQLEGAVDNIYGLYIGTLTSAAHDEAYAIFSQDPGAMSYFAGPIAIGTDNVKGMLTVLSTNTSNDVAMEIIQIGGDGAAGLEAIKAKGTPSAPQAVGLNDNIFSLVASGYNGTEPKPATGIDSLVDGTPGTYMPGRLEFRTNDGQQDEPVARMVIKSDGKVGISTGLPQAMLDIVSTGTYAQIWRNAQGVAVATMTAAGELFASVNTSSITAYALTVSTGSGYILAVTTNGVAIGDIYYSTGSLLRVYGYARNANAAIEDINLGVDSVIRSKNTGPEDILASGDFQTEIDNSGQAKLAVGVHSGVRLNSAAVVDQVIGLMLSSFENSGTIGETYGIYIDTLTHGTQTQAPYALYSRDPYARTFFAGGVGIATSTPRAALDVRSSTATAGSPVQIWRDSTGLAVATMTVEGSMLANAARFKGSLTDPREFLISTWGAAGIGDFTDVNVDTVAVLTLSAKLAAVNMSGDKGGVVALYAQAASRKNAAYTGGMVLGANFEASLHDQDNIADLVAIRAQLRKEGTISGAVATRAVGLLIDDMYAYSGGGTLTDTYGIYIAKQSSSPVVQTNAPYALYSDDPAARTYFAGNVGIGTAAPAAQLDIVAAGSYAQIWRNAAGVPVATMTAAGVLESSNSLTVGGEHGGGRIFWVDPTGAQALVMAPTDLSGAWAPSATEAIGAVKTGKFAGSANTIIISTTYGPGTYAARRCEDHYVTGVDGAYYDDWYLPSKEELQQLHSVKGIVPGAPATGSYWSSNESNASWAYYVDFTGGGATQVAKGNSYNVRCVRAAPAAPAGRSRHADYVRDGAYLASTQTFTGSNTFAALDVRGPAKVRRHLAEANGATRNITGDDLGKTIVFNSGSPATFTLIAGTAQDLGATITFVKLGTGKLTIQASGGEYIGASTSGGTIYNDAVSPADASVTLQLVETGKWVIISGQGVWIAT